MSRHRPFAWHRLAILAVLIGLAVIAGLYLRGPDSWQRRYYRLEHVEAIQDSATRHQVSPFLIASVIRAESDWEPDARSEAGAVGLMQIMPSSAKDLARWGIVDAERFPVDSLSEPDVNIEYGTAYIRYLVRRYHEIEAALAAYNAGLGNADKWVAEGGDIRESIDFPATRHYVLKVVRGKDRYEALYPDVFEGWTTGE